MNPSPVNPWCWLGLAIGPGVCLGVWVRAVVGVRCHALGPDAYAPPIEGARTWADKDAMCRDAGGYFY